jgi:hypothetical protein
VSFTTNLTSKGIPEFTSNESVICIWVSSLFLLILFTNKVSTWPSSPVLTVLANSASIEAIVEFVSVLYESKTSYLTNLKSPPPNSSLVTKSARDPSIYFTFSCKLTMFWDAELTSSDKSGTYNPWLSSPVIKVSAFFSLVETWINSVILSTFSDILSNCSVKVLILTSMVFSK